MAAPPVIIAPDPSCLACPAGMALACRPYALTREFPLFRLTVDWHQPPLLRPGRTYTVDVEVENRMLCQQWLRFSWLGADGFDIFPAGESLCSLEQYHGNVGKAHIRFTLRAPETLERDKRELVLAVRANGRHSQYFIPFALLHTGEEE